MRCAVTLSGEKSICRCIISDSFSCPDLSPLPYLKAEEVIPLAHYKKLVASSEEVISTLKLNGF